MKEEFSWPSSRLLKLWCEWIDLHTVLEQGLPRGERDQIAAPFFSAASSQKCPNRILVVGKATGGDNWWLGEYRRALRESPNEAIRSRLRRNREIVRTGGNGQAFLKLFERFTKLFPEPDSCSLIWSNLAKIGCLKGNPEGILFSAQKDLAERTLREEIKEYDPVLVVFATSKYRGDVINRALDLRDEDWQQSKSDRDRELYWREGPPAMLGTRHPRGVNKVMIDFWVETAGRLVGVTAGRPR